MNGVLKAYTEFDTIFFLATIIGGGIIVTGLVMFFITKRSDKIIFDIGKQISGQQITLSLMISELNDKMDELNNRLDRAGESLADMLKLVDFSWPDTADVGHPDAGTVDILVKDFTGSRDKVGQLSFDNITS